MSSGVVKLVQTTIFFGSVVWIQVPCTALSGLADVEVRIGWERIFLVPKSKVAMRPLFCHVPGGE